MPYLDREFSEILKAPKISFSMDFCYFSQGIVIHQEDESFYFLYSWIER
jgi:hypothetical protein